MLAGEQLVDALESKQKLQRNLGAEQAEVTISHVDTVSCGISVL